MDGFPQDIPGLLFPAGVALFAGLVRGLTGFGGPLIMILALSIWYPARLLAPAVLLSDFVSNLGMLPAAARDADRRTVLAALVGAIVALPVGLQLLLHGDRDLLRAIINGVVLTAAIVLLSGWRVARPLKAPELAGAGFLSGLIMGATSIAIAIVPFLFAGPESPARSRGNLICWLFAATAVMLGTMLIQGAIGGPVLTLAAILAPAYLAGVTIGARLFGRIDPVRFRRLVLAALVLFAAIGLLR